MQTARHLRAQPLRVELHLFDREELRNRRSTLFVHDLEQVRLDLALGGRRRDIEHRVHPVFEVLRAAIEGEHHRVARDHLEIFAADPGGAYRDRRSQDRLQHRSEEHTSELQSLMRISYAVFCLKKKNKNKSSFTTNM